jgi:diguanylate cyclase (GGDEF)-like protein
MFIDLDRFKPINDIHGHEIGDKLLREIANRLQKTVRSNDIVARIGGDEFVILLEDVNEASDLSVLADKIIKEINRPAYVENLELDVGCCIGISIFPEDGEDNRSILHSADIAMYAAKADGRNRYFFFSSEYN